MRAKVIKKYRQRETGIVVTPNTTLEVTPERFAEINAHKLGPFLEEIGLTPAEAKAKADAEKAAAKAKKDAEKAAAKARADAEKAGAADEAEKNAAGAAGDGDALPDGEQAEN